ncbi:MAG: hypothetical protein GX267_09040 [Fibrobacter sp.]|jgi:hypothetical protein|nr:hypothetical protein [Fibrobacter sp.]
MKKHLFFLLLLCFFGNGNTDSTSLKKLDYLIDTLISISFSDKECTGCINSNEYFPYDFTVDSKNNIYLIEDGLKNIRKIDSEGKTIWNHSTAPVQHSVIHIFKNKLYAFDGIILEARNMKTGEIENEFDLPIDRDSLFSWIDIFYFYENLLYVKYNCPEMSVADGYSVLIFDIQNGKRMIRANCVNYGYSNDKNVKNFWPISDCADCLKELNGLRSDKFEGQSSRYMIIGLPKDPKNKEDYRLLVFDKVLKKKYMTDLNKYYSESWGSNRFKFLSPNIAVTNIAEYKKGMPYKLHIIKVKFQNQ